MDRDQQRDAGAGAPSWRDGATVSPRESPEGEVFDITPAGGVTATVPAAVVDWLDNQTPARGSLFLSELEALAQVPDAYYGPSLLRGPELDQLRAGGPASPEHVPAQSVARTPLTEVIARAAEIGRAMADARRRAGTSTGPNVDPRVRRTVGWLLTRATWGGGANAAVIAICTMYDELPAEPSAALAPRRPAGRGASSSRRDDSAWATPPDRRLGVKRRGIVEQLADELRHMIGTGGLSGQLRPARLADRYDVSLDTVYQALRRIERDHPPLVRRTRGGVRPRGVWIVISNDATAR